MTTNLRLVLRTYSALRQMSPDDIALLETLRALNDNDRELLVEMMTDKPVGKKAGKKSSTSKSSQPSTKSSRASGMAAQLNTRLAGRERERREQEREMASQNGQCVYELSYGLCLQSADDNIHHLTTHPKYHEFVEGKSSAPPAPTRSPANGGAESTTPNSEASAVSAGAATGGSSE